MYSLLPSFSPSFKNTAGSPSQSQISTSATNIKDTFFQCAKHKQVLNSESEEIWTLIQPLLPDFCDQKCKLWLEEFCQKILMADKNTREEVLTTAAPLISLCTEAEDKFQILNTLFKVPEQLRKAVIEVAPLAFHKMIEDNGSGIGEALVELCAVSEEELEGVIKHWLEENPTAKNVFLNLAKENSASDSDAQKVWKTLQPCLPQPWNHRFDSFLVRICEEIFKVERNHREEILITLQPLCDLCTSADEKLMILGFVWKMPENLRKPIIEMSLFNANDKTMQTGIGFCMIATLSEELLEEWLAKNLKIKERFENLTIHLPKEDELIEQQIAGLFPALQGYQPANRSPNSSHLNRYGGEEVQDKFRQGQRKSLNFALYTNQQNKIPTDAVNELKRYRERLEGLGARRMRTALVCGTKEWDKFGCPSSSGIMVRMDNFKEVYRDYAEEIIKHGSNSIGINGTSHLLTLIGEYTFDYCYKGFWENDDPLFLVMANLYKQINQNKMLEGEPLRVSIAKYHWRMANGLFWQSGTASIAEVDTDSMWIGHDHNPPEGKCLDLRALSMSEEEYIKIYPMGKKIK